MTATFDDQSVWLLVGSQHYYGSETLARVDEQARRLVDRLNGSADLPVRVVWRPVLIDSDSIRRTVLEADADDHCIGVIAWMHTFSPARLWIRGLSALLKPLLHLHTQDNVDLPFATIDPSFMDLNQSAHGDREFAYLLTRMGIARKTVVGHVSDPAVTKRIGAWQRGAAGAADLRDLTVVRFGDNMRQVADTDGDRVDAHIVLGASLDTYAVDDVVRVIDAVPEPEVAALVTEYLDVYDVAPELAPGGARHESLRDAARQESGLRRFLVDHRAGAWSMSFEDMEGLRQLPGFAAQRLMAAGYGYGPEGDWKTPMIVRAALTMGAGLPGGASLMEDYTYHLAPGHEGVLGSHMLEISPSLTTTRPRLEIHPLPVLPREDPVRLRFTADPSPATVVSITDVGDGFRLLANRVDIVEPDEPMPHLPTATAFWRPRPDFHTSVTSWLNLGGGHHTALTTALDAEPFEDLARILGVDWHLIDEHTPALRP